MALTHDFILETAATFKLKQLKLDSVMPQRSTSTAQAFCLTHLNFKFQVEISIS